MRNTLISDPTKIFRLPSSVGAPVNKRLSNLLRGLLSATLFLMLSVGATGVYAQKAPADTDDKHTVQGVVRDEFGEILPAANIYLKDKPTVGTVSNADGSFRFPGKLSEGDVVVFSFVGHSPLEYTVSADIPAALNIELLMNEMVGAPAGNELYSTHSLAGRMWARVKQLFD